MAFVALIVALCASASASARMLLDTATCAQGVPYEVYPSNDMGHTLHSILNYKANVASLDECARLCKADPACTCAWYPVVGGACTWRVGKCTDSELFIAGAVPTSSTQGLISICPAVAAATPAPPAATPSPPTVTTTAATATALSGPGCGNGACTANFGQCGGLNYTASSKQCCDSTFHCVQQVNNIYYAQCVPVALGGSVLSC